MISVMVMSMTVVINTGRTFGTVASALTWGNLSDEGTRTDRTRGIVFVDFGLRCYRGKAR